MKKWRSFFQSIRFIFILAFILCLLIPILAMNLYGHLFTSRILSEQAVERSQYEVHLQSEHLVHNFELLHANALYVSALRSFSKYRESNRAGDDADSAIWRLETEQDLLVFVSTNALYHRIRYINEDGTEIFVIETDDQNVRVRPHDLLGQYESSTFDIASQLQGNAVYTTSFFLDPASDDPNAPIILQYVLRLPNRDGMIIFDVHASWVLRNMPLSNSRVIWALMNRQGQHLIYPTSTDPAAAFEDVLTKANQRMATFFPIFTNAPSGAFETSDSVFIFTRLTPSADLPNEYWTLYQEVPKANLYAGIDDFFLKSLFIIGVAVLNAVGMAIFLSGQIINPVVELQRQASSFMHGIILPPSEHQPLHEIGELSRTFHEMATELEEQRRYKHALIKRLIHAQEEERKIIAYDLHDGLLQQLVGARLYFSMLRSNTQDSSEEMQHGCDALTEAITEGRRIIEGLHPPILDDLGLIEAISELAHKSAEIHGWQLTLEIEPIPHEPDKTVSVTVFRIVQEALNNIFKHAKAKHVTIRMSNGAEICVVVQDDGVGYEPSITRRGFGLTTMHERATLLNGTCDITSSVGKGTQVYVTLPYVYAEESISHP